MTAIRRRLADLGSFGRPVWLYMVVGLVVGITISNGIYPVLFNLYLLRVGYGPEFIGIANAVGLLASAAFSLPAGMAADRWGLRRTMIWGMAVAVACHSLLPLFDLAPAAWQEPGIIVMRGLSSLGLTAYMVNAVPFLMHITGSAERNRAFSVRQAFMPFSGFFGSLAGGALPGIIAALLSTPTESVAPFRWGLIVGGLLCLPTIPLLAAISDDEVEPEPATEASSDDGAFPWAVALPLLIVGLLSPAAVGGVRTFYNVYLDEALGMDTAQIGTLFSIAFLVGAPIALLMPRMSRRWGLRVTTVITSLGVAASSVLMGLVPNWIAASVARVGVAGISSISYASMAVFQMALVRRQWRATISGLTSLASGLCWAALSFGGGYIITGLGYRTLFLLGGGLSAAGALIFGLHFRVPRGQVTDPNMS